MQASWLRHVLVPVLLILGGGIADALAQATPTPSAAAAGPRAPATGDGWLDRQLLDIDRYAARYPDAFADELERYAGVPRAYTQALAQQPGWHPGDVWFACVLGRAVQATCRAVVRQRAVAGPDADWSAVAEGFEAAPGGAAYRSIRLALADSYRRWARPLDADAALRRALREREQARQRDEAATAR